MSGHFDIKSQLVRYADVKNEWQVDDEVHIFRILVELRLALVKVKSATFQHAETSPPE